MYYFTHIPPIQESKRFRAFHPAEIRYVFGNPGSDANWTDVDRKLSRIISSYWVNFAKTGNPNGRGLPDWQRYDAESDPAIELGDSVILRHEENKAGLDFLDRLT
jgi:para-nitrobenzyl esterase